MKEVTLTEILDAREMRAFNQKKLIDEYKLPLICFTMNIAGPVKVTSLTERAFFEGIAILEEKLGTATFKKIHTPHTGYEAFFVYNEDATFLKSICVQIEESCALGRLFDMDVLTAEGRKLDRKVERGCLICGKSGRECSSSRAHSVEELVCTTNEIIANYFLEKDAKTIENLALESLIFEVNTTPKPGLVDQNNNGSHKDMNIDLFLKSAESISYYFKECFKTGYLNKAMKDEDVFNKLRALGIEAEKKMYNATNNINTHKGIIYSLGIICGAVGKQYDGTLTYTASLFPACAELVKASVKKDFETLCNKTAGERFYNEHKIKGIRGEAESGFSSVSGISLPAFEEAVEQGMSLNDSGVFALLKLIEKVEDTNLLNRGGIDGLLYAQKCAEEILSDSSRMIENTLILDESFISKNLSPGGCADLLALTYFIYKLKRG